MRSISILIAAAFLAACASVQPAPAVDVSACAASEVSYACQVERYNHVND